MANLKDLLPTVSIENLTASQAVEGSVFRMHLGKEEGIIDKKPGDNAFLSGIDRYVDCSDFKIISKKRFAELFGEENAKGTVDAASLATIKQMTSSYEDASPKLLKRFGLI